MKKTITKLLLLVSLPMLMAADNLSTSGNSETYDVKRIYVKTDLKSGSKCIDDWGNIEDAEAVLVTTSLEGGKYQVEITRKASNFYKIEGTDIYIETSYCYEYATYEDVIFGEHLEK